MQVRRQEGRQGPPPRDLAEQATQAMQGVVDGVELARGDVQAFRPPAPPDRPVGREQLVEADLVAGLGHDRQRLRRAAREDVAAEGRPRHQPLAGLLHGLQPLQPVAQGGGQLGAARLVLAPRLGQQQARLQIGQPRGHDQIVGRQLEVQPPGLAHELEVLVGQRQDRDPGQVDLLLAGQLQQHVDRPAVAVQVQDEWGVFRSSPWAIVFEGRRIAHRAPPVSQAKNGQSHDTGLTTIQ